MELNLKNWTKKDISEFESYLNTLKNKEKVEWSRKIICTNYPLLAIKTPAVRKLSQEIAQGNYISFLDHMPHSTYDILAICGFLIPHINDFKTIEKYLAKYADLVDCWAGCDLLKFKVTAQNEADYFNLASRYIRSNKTYVRRIGLIILFEFTENEKYLDKVFDLIRSLKTEQEYYVNMAVAWLVAELVIKNRDKTLKFLDTDPLNAFTINKAVQKCRDSFRVTSADKQMLLKYKKTK